MTAKSNLTNLARDIRLLALDVDGVMTDGGIILTGTTGEAKRFDVQDGMAIAMARLCGWHVAIVSGRASEVTQRRAAELGIADVYVGVKDKRIAMGQLLATRAIAPHQVAYMGDDWNDLGVMEMVGLPIAVQNARPEVKEQAAYVTQARGGYGAVREVVELLMDLQEKRHTVLQHFMSPLILGGEGGETPSGGSAPNPCVRKS